MFSVLFPRHIILDVTNAKKNNLNKNWINKFLTLKTKNIFSETYFDLIINNNKLNKIFKQKKISHLNSICHKNFNFKKILSNSTFVGNLNSIFNIIFLRKEKIYTKLKYSRVPQYDIVSGGVALLFAGFIGFLVSEKFGFELADSGDFYYFFMYLVFIFFILKLFLKLFNSNQVDWNVFSPKWFFFFIKTTIFLFFKFIKNILI